MSTASRDRRPPFLNGGGELGERIARFDWPAIGLPSLDDWPPHIKTATALTLRCQVPMVLLWGERGVMIYNDAYAAVAGARHPALLGSDVRAGWPEVADFNDHVMKSVLAGRNLQYVDQELTLHRNGRAEQVWMNLDYSPLLDESGVPAGVMALVVETTAKVRAEQLVAGEHDRLARLFEQAPSFMALLDGPSHVFRLANPNYMRLVGHRAVLGRSVAEAVPEAVAQGYVELLDQVYASGEAFAAYGSRLTVQRDAGRPPSECFLDFVYQPIRSSTGEVTGIFVQGVDVTDRMSAERRRHALTLLTDVLRGVDQVGEIVHLTAQVLGETLQVSRVGYGTVDDGSDVLLVDRDWTAPGVESLRGATRLRDDGSLIDDLKRDAFVSIADVRLDPRTAAVADALERKSARSVVQVPVVERGRLVAVLFVNDARVRHWDQEDLALIREVAQRTRTVVERAAGEQALRASEARLREANETLEAKVEQRTRELFEIEERYRQAQKMEAIGQLTGGIAHDFNNLLAAMSSSLQILKRKLHSGLTDDADRYLDMAGRSVDRAASLTQRLLAFSRRQTLDPRPTDVNRLIAGLEDLIRRTVGPAVSVEVHADPGLWLTRVDPPQLESALLNLCINARDAMARDGGRLTIATSNEALDPVAAAARELEAGEYVLVSVSDTGMGMSADTLARAFDPFFTTKPIGEGTGLGLSMVYGFVRQSGGQVRAHSTPGHGTTMNLYLPRHAGDSTASIETAGATAADARASGETILLIEDEPTIRVLLAEELRALGYRVIAVEHGAAGLQVLQSTQPLDLLISDVGLPGSLNGRQVADAGRVTRPQLKVLFITGYAQNAAVGNGLLGDGMDVLTKPFQLEALAAKVRAIIER